METTRFDEITGRYTGLRVALVGDFCLDRYLEIDPGKKEISIETGLPVYNVVRVRAQPGGAGTILNNLVALGIGRIYPVGFSGVDGEGFELRQALAAQPGVMMDYFLETPLRRTFTYCKPLVMESGKTPLELNRLDSKNWTVTPEALQKQLVEAIQSLSSKVDAMIFLSQVDLPETGVITKALLAAVDSMAKARPELLMIADSRSGLKGYPRVCLKMNRAEFFTLIGHETGSDFSAIRKELAELARTHGRTIFVTAAEEGIVACSANGEIEEVPALPLRGEIDIVGAGDSVTANLAAALAGGANLREALELANAAASTVIHQLGTTGTASVQELRELLAC